MSYDPVPRIRCRVIKWIARHSSATPRRVFSEAPEDSLHRKFGDEIVIDPSAEPAG